MFVSARNLATVAAWTSLLTGCVSEQMPTPIVQPFEGHVTTSDDVQLYYRTVGAGRDTIVILHGGPGLDHGYLVPDLEPLADALVLIAYDQRGAGRSTVVEDAAALGIEAHISDLEELRAHLGIDRMALLGHSWGALLAARYALEHPDNVSRLVFVSPAPLRRTPHWQHLMPNVTRWMDSTTLAEYLRLSEALLDPAQDAASACRRFWGLLVRGYFADPEDMATIGRMRGDFCTAPNPAIRNTFVVNASTWRSIGDWDWLEDFRSVPIPALIITGVRDVFPVEAMREWEAAFPNAQLVLLEGSGHYPHVERAAEFFDALGMFMR
jgi:proline iminopeptidase